MASRKSSILKPSKVREPFQDLDQLLPNNEEEESTCTTNTDIHKRRVSFASINKVKEFNTGAECATLLDTPAYDERFSISSDSYQSSLCLTREEPPSRAQHTLSQPEDMEQTSVLDCADSSMEITDLIDAPIVHARKSIFHSEAEEMAASVNRKSIAPPLSRISSIVPMGILHELSEKSNSTAGSAVLFDGSSAHDLSENTRLNVTDMVFTLEKSCETNSTSQQQALSLEKSLYNLELTNGNSSVLESTQTEQLECVKEIGRKSIFAENKMTLSDKTVLAEHSMVLTLEALSQPNTILTENVSHLLPHDTKRKQDTDVSSVAMSLESTRSDLSLVEEVELVTKSDKTSLANQSMVLTLEALSQPTNTSTETENHLLMQNLKTKERDIVAFPIAMSLESSPSVNNDKVISGNQSIVDSPDSAKIANEAGSSSSMQLTDFIPNPKQSYTCANIISHEVDKLSQQSAPNLSAHELNDARKSNNSMVNDMSNANGYEYVMPHVDSPVNVNSLEDTDNPANADVSMRDDCPANAENVINAVSSVNAELSRTADRHTSILVNGVSPENADETVNAVALGDSSNSQDTSDGSPITFGVDFSIIQKNQKTRFEFSSRVDLLKKKKSLSNVQLNVTKHKFGNDKQSRKSEVRFSIPSVGANLKNTVVSENSRTKEGLTLDEFDKNNVEQNLHSEKKHGRKRHSLEMYETPSKRPEKIRRSLTRSSMVASTYERSSDSEIVSLSNRNILIENEMIDVEISDKNKMDVSSVNLEDVNEAVFPNTNNVDMGSIKHIQNGTATYDVNHKDDLKTKENLNVETNAVSKNETFETNINPRISLSHGDVNIVNNSIGLEEMNRNTISTSRNVIEPNEDVGDMKHVISKSKHNIFVKDETNEDGSDENKLNTSPTRNVDGLDVNKVDINEEINLTMTPKSNHEELRMKENLLGKVNENSLAGKLKIGSNENGEKEEEIENYLPLTTSTPFHKSTKNVSWLSNCSTNNITEDGLKTSLINASIIPLVGDSFAPDVMIDSFENEMASISRSKRKTEDVSDSVKASNCEDNLARTVEVVDNQQSPPRSVNKVFDQEPPQLLNEVVNDQELTNVVNKVNDTELPTNKSTTNQELPLLTNEVVVKDPESSQLVNEVVKDKELTQMTTNQELSHSLRQKSPKLESHISKDLELTRLNIAEEINDREHMACNMESLNLKNSNDDIAKLSRTKLFPEKVCEHSEDEILEQELSQMDISDVKNDNMQNEEIYKKQEADKLQKIPDAKKISDLDSNKNVAEVVKKNSNYRDIEWMDASQIDGVELDYTKAFMNNDTCLSESLLEKKLEIGKKIQNDWNVKQEWRIAGMTSHVWIFRFLCERLQLVVKFVDDTEDPTIERMKLVYRPFVKPVNECKNEKAKICIYPLIRKFDEKQLKALCSRADEIPYLLKLLAPPIQFTRLLVTDVFRLEEYHQVKIKNKHAEFRVCSIKNHILSKISINIQYLDRVSVDDIRIKNDVGNLDVSAVRRVFTECGRGYDMLSTFVRKIRFLANHD